MCCGKTLIHIFKFCFVLLLLASGIALIAAGSVVTGDENGYIDLIGSKLIQVAIFEICLGIIIVLISFVGGVWAWKENKMFMWAYISMLCMICVMEFSGGVAAFVYKDDVASQTNLSLTENFVTDISQLPSTWNNMQKTVECCGLAKGPDDFPTDTLPESCCPSHDDPCSKGRTDKYENACINATTNALENDANILGGMAFGMGILQLAGLLFTCADILLIKCIKCMCPCCCS